MFKVCETASSEAQALLSQIKEDLKLLNQITSKMSRETLTREGLHSEYILGAIGDPHIGSGFKPIFSSSTPDRDRARALSRDIDYNHYRNKLKVQKCSIPMIWDRFPPQNFEEREQMREDLQKWEAQKASQRLKEDRKPTFQKTPLELHFEREAKRESKRTQIPIAKLLASPDFRERQKSIFDLLQSMLPEDF